MLDGLLLPFAKKAALLLPLVAALIAKAIAARRHGLRPGTPKPHSRPWVLMLAVVTGILWLGGPLLLFAAAVAVGPPMVVAAVVSRVAVRSRRPSNGLPELNAAPRLSIPAFAAGLVGLFPLPMVPVVRWALEKLIVAGMLSGPPSKTMAILVPAGLSAVGFLLGAVSLYQIGVSPDRLRGKTYAYAALVLCWCWCGFLLVLALPRASADDRVDRLCGANVAKLAAALRMYAEDHQDVFPPEHDWRDLVEPYLEEEGELEHTPWWCRYAYNTALAGKRLEQITDPSKLVVVFEFGSLLTINDPWWNLAGGRQDLPESPCHRFGDNYGFADGSHRWLPRKRLGTDAGATVWARETNADWVEWEP
jgi:hypothetical protein